MQLKTGTGIIYEDQKAILIGKYTIFLESTDDEQTGLFETHNLNPRKLEEFTKRLTSNPSLYLQIEGGTRFPIRVKTQPSLYVSPGSAHFEIAIHKS